MTQSKTVGCWSVLVHLGLVWFFQDCDTAKDGGLWKFASSSLLYSGCFMAFSDCGPVKNSGLLKCPSSSLATLVFQVPVWPAKDGGLLKFPSSSPLPVHHPCTLVISGPCLTMTHRKTAGCPAKALGSTTVTSCMWPMPAMTSGGRPRESHLREKRRGWGLSPVNEGKLTNCSWTL